MPFHLSLIACRHRASDMMRMRQELDALALRTWASPGVVAVVALVDTGSCGRLTAWPDKAAFETWRQRIDYKRMRDFFADLPKSDQFAFDCAFHETDLAPLPDSRSRPGGPGRGSVVVLRGKEMPG